MIRILGCITDQHEPWLVALAALTCAFGCFTTLSVLARARAGTNGPWLASAAVTGGASIWTTHFVAMLSYHPGFAVGYDIPLTILSIMFAMSLSWAAFWVALHYNAAAGGALFGGAVGAMHYTGMAALAVPAHFHWDGDYVLISIVSGIAFGAVALSYFTRRSSSVARIVAAILLTLAIASHHFTAMSALTLTLDPLAHMSSGSVIAPPLMAAAVALVMIVIAAFGLAGSVIDQRFAQRVVDEAARLRAHVEALEATKADLNRALLETAEANEAKSRFLAAMSHELRTPLNAIIGFSEVMRRETFGPHSDPRYRDYAGDVHSSGRHLLQLINDILDFSKIDAGHFRIDDTVMRPIEIIHEAVQMVRRQADDAGISIHETEGDNSLLRADERRVRQVLLNLLSNAVKFTPNGGHVRVTVSRRDDGLAIAVADTGIGIAAADIPRAFEPFLQVDNSLARKYEGTGLGLPLSRRLMEMHGGTLEIESTVGIGTTVTMRFPIVRVVAAPATDDATITLATQTALAAA